ncbi:hypothetical protein Gohar_006408, partial [Gossypium harknessii]|nr:hypothetical protein [Gossypium harknessii]
MLHPSRLQLGSYIKNAAACKSLLEYPIKGQCEARWCSTNTCFKGHNMLAPFTPGWQTTEVNPLVIVKSELQVMKSCSNEESLCYSLLLSYNKFDLAQGSYVYDINEKKYLDTLAGLWCTALGGNEPRLVAAATDQLNKLPFYHSFWNHWTLQDLAKELTETFTATKMAKVFFTNSGSEANDTQVKLVWYYNNALGRPKKKKFIARAKASSGETEEDFSTRLANNLENLILKEGPETIAAFIAEPVMGAGGVIPPPATYFEKVRVLKMAYIYHYEHGFTNVALSNTMQ